MAPSARRSGTQDQEDEYRHRAQGHTDPRPPPDRSRSAVSPLHLVFPHCVRPIDRSSRRGRTTGRAGIRRIPFGMPSRTTDSASHGGGSYPDRDHSGKGRKRLSYNNPLLATVPAPRFAPRLRRPFISGPARPTQRLNLGSKKDQVRCHVINRGPNMLSFESVRRSVQGPAR